MYPDQRDLSTLQQNSRTRTILQHPNSPFSAKLWKFTILAKYKVPSWMDVTTTVVYHPRILAHSYLLLG
jgi:hypothetical protein